MSRRSEKRHKLRKKRRRERRALNRQYPEYMFVGTVSGRFRSTPELLPGVDALPMKLPMSRREFARFLLRVEKDVAESETMQAGLRVYKANERGEYPLPPDDNGVEQRDKKYLKDKEEALDRLLLQSPVMNDMFDFLERHPDAKNVVVSGRRRLQIWQSFARNAEARDKK